MSPDQYFRAIENFTAQEMPNLTRAQISNALVTLLSRVIVSASGGLKDETEALLEITRHELDIEVGRASKQYARS